MLALEILCPCRWGFLPIVFFVRKSIGRELPGIQWLGLCAFTSEGAGSIPGRGTKIPQAMWCRQKKEKKINRQVLCLVFILYSATLLSALFNSRGFYIISPKFSRYVIISLAFLLIFEISTWNSTLVNVSLIPLMHIHLVLPWCCLLGLLLLLLFFLPKPQRTLIQWPRPFPI